jgi:hypothetical protein
VHRRGGRQGGVLEDGKGRRGWSTPASGSWWLGGVGWGGVGWGGGQAEKRTREGLRKEDNPWRLRWRDKAWVRWAHTGSSVDGAFSH